MQPTTPSPDAITGLFLTLCGLVLVASIRYLTGKNGDSQTSNGGILSSLFKGNANKTPDQTPKLTIEERVGAMESELSEVRRERDEARKDRDEATTERDNAREEIGKLRSEFQAKINDLQKRLDQLEMLGQEKDKNIARITAELDAKEKDYKALLIKYTERQDTVISMGNELNDLEIRVEALTIDNKAHKSLDMLVDEFGKRLVPALLVAVRDAIRAAGETKITPQESAP